MARGVSSCSVKYVQHFAPLQKLHLFSVVILIFFLAMSFFGAVFKAHHSTSFANGAALGVEARYNARLNFLWWSQCSSIGTKHE